MALLQTMSNMFDAWGSPCGGEAQEETSLLEKRHVVPKGSSVAEHADPLLRRLLAGREMENFPDPEKKGGVSSESRGHPLDRPLRLFRKIGMVSILNIAADSTAKYIGRS